MKKILLIISAIIMLSCIKSPMSNNSTPHDEQVEFTFNFYQKGNAKMVCVYDNHSDTVTATIYSKTITKTAYKSIYPHSDIQMNMTGQLIGTSSLSDSVWVSISINGKVVKTSGKAGHNDYYYETANATYSW